MSDKYISSLMTRSGSKCELCGNPEDLKVFAVTPRGDQADECALLCALCRMENLTEQPETHWYCLQESIWSDIPAIQALSWRRLNQIDETWAKDALESAYLEEDILIWATSTPSTDLDTTPTLDSNGTPLADGDSVTIIKDLNVKGAGFVAKRGTTVRRIRLTDNPEYIEGRVNKTMIALKTCFLKKVKA